METTVQKIEAIRAELVEQQRQDAVRGVSRSQRAAWLKRRITVLSARAS